jgi:hypothetical protein
VLNLLIPQALSFIAVTSTTGENIAEAILSYLLWKNGNLMLIYCVGKDMMEPQI